MFKPSKSKSVKDYLAAVPEKQKQGVLFLHSFIQKSVPKEKPYFANNMIGYGSFPYLNYKKEKIEWPLIALSARKNYISLYVCALAGSQYVAEKYKRDLGKVSVGKSCIRIKNLEDLNLKTLKQVLKEASKNPGLTKA